MDIQREGVAEKKRKQRIIWMVAGGLALAIAAIGLARLKPAAPRVERSAVWIGGVERGAMVRQVRGPGTLVPEEVRWIPATTSGTVERIVLLPGSIVEPDSVILELRSPEVVQAALESEADVRAAEADLLTLRARLESEALTQQSVAGAAHADYEEAKMRAEADAELAREGLVSELNRKLSALRAAELGKRDELERERVGRGEEGLRAQLAAQRARLEQVRALHRLRAEERAQLRVAAGIAGVLEEVPVEVGQRVAPGANLARVARPERLKAELRIAETQAKDVIVGLPVEIDTRNGIVKGQVARVDPSAREGTVTVDVRLTDELPKGARPRLSVDGTIELENLADVLYVRRPAYGQPGSSVGLFKLDPDGKHATRVTVQLGRASVNTVEVLAGLAVGDQVILSDMSAWDAFERVRLR